MKIPKFVLSLHKNQFSFGIISAFLMILLLLILTSSPLGNSLYSFVLASIPMWFVIFVIFAVDAHSSEDKYNIELCPEIKCVAEQELKLFIDSKMSSLDQKHVNISAKIEKNIITIFEHKIISNDSEQMEIYSVAQLRFDWIRDRWHLFWCDRENRWNPYKNLPFSKNLKILLSEINRDANKCFWNYI